MRLTGRQFSQLQKALISAFPDLGALERLVRIHLDLNLGTIAAGRNLTEITHHLIAWAEAQGRVDDLLAGAEADNPGNEDLRVFATAYRAAPPPPPEPVPREPDRAPSVEPERPLVDREEMVSVLTAEVARVNEEHHARSLVLVGDSGIGKSRLAAHAGSVARDAGMLVLQAQCVGQGAEPLLPLRDSLASVRNHLPVEQLLDESPGDAQESIEFVRAFLSIDDPRSPSPRLGGSRDKGVYEGLAKVLLELAARPGLCLVVEDLTEADQDTLHFLEYFWRKADAARVLTISTVKRDFVDDRLDDLLNKWEADGSVRWEVPPLGADDATTLISLLWEGPPLAEDRIAQIVTLSGGNPFFIEQILSLVADDPALAASLTDVPPRVQAVLRRRLDRIDDDTHSFLEAAAVAVEAAHHLELIAGVAEIDVRTASKLLRRACDLGCLTEDRLGAITFVQELLRLVVYDAIPPAVRRAMHRRAAEWLEAEDLLSSAARHYEQAELTEDLVRTALKGAARAENSGLYRHALQLYERVLPFADLATIGVRMATAYIVVGEWGKAHDVLDRLPSDDRDVRVLRSHLCFVRGDFSGALEEMELALQTPSGDRVGTLIRLSDIHLYLGHLGKAGEYANQALAGATAPALVAKCKGLLGATALFGGDVDGGERCFTEAMAVLSDQPDEERDPAVYTTILGNLGQVNAVRGRWDEAKRLHEEALRLRRTVSDARGELQSIHAVAQAEVGLGSIDDGARSLEEARKLASVLGERLEEGKIDLTAATISLLAGEPAAAVRSSAAALQRFRESRVAYDVAHARFVLARSVAATGAHRRALEEGAKARADMHRQGFGLLARLFPDTGFWWSERIEAGILAYACGDALGLPWEGSPPAQIDADRIPSLPAPDGWDRGSTSDDTALTLLVAEHLVTSRGPDPGEFLELLAARAPSIRGLGPSTTGAVEHFRATGTTPTDGGNTNGAVMRSLPVGWALPLDRVEDRRQWTIELSRATHPGSDACCAACVGSACAAWALEGAGPELLLEVAAEEAAATAQRCGADDRLHTMLSALAAGTWMPPAAGVTLDPYDTLVSALWCIRREGTLGEALLAAVRIGGDTDTVAALVGGLVGCRHQPAEVDAQLPWIGEVQMPDRAAVAGVARGLAGLRSRGRDG